MACLRWRSRRLTSGSAAARTSGVAKILKDTAYFLKEQKKITAVKDSYAEFVDPQYAEAAKALSN